MSGHVTSHTSERLLFQGIIVPTSGLLPSELTRPEGSRWEGVFAEVRALCVEDATDRLMTMVAALTPKTMECKLVNLCTTVMPGMWMISGKDQLQYEWFHCPCEGP